MIEQPARPIIIENELVYSGAFLSVRKLKIQINEKTTERELVQRKDGVAIVPIDTVHNILLIKEYYAGSNSFLYSLPGGSIENDKTPEHEAMRELREETGYRAEKMIKLHYTYSHPAISIRRSYTFLAYDLIWDPLPDSDEFIEVLKLPLEEAIRLAHQDFESDMSTIGNLLMARDKLRELGL
jgi:8-oxo-dGTP pyrophosphatase MutT (NUDIX family)